MTLEQLRKTLRTQPFRPFTIHMGDGRVLKVPHPDFVWTHPEGQRTVVVGTGTPDDFEIIDLMLVTSIEVVNGRPQRG
ncbi:MAG: hypothetical protein AB1716_23905 [Planctomycetota bacterium]